MQDLIVKLDKKAEVGEPYDALIVGFDTKKDAQSEGEDSNSSAGEE